jgi:hypothetical protein
VGKNLQRVTPIIQTLCQYDLSLRDQREPVVCNSNPGNFLALLKYLAKSYLVRIEHLDSACGKLGCLSYFSQDIKNELIDLLGIRVRRTVIS